MKQHSTVTYLGRLLDENLSRESRATKILGKINVKLEFLYRKQNFLDSSLRRLLLNALIQPHFDYAFTSWYQMLNKRLFEKSSCSKQMHSLLPEFKMYSPYWPHRIQGYKLAPHKE